MPRILFDETDESAVIAAIRKAELRTSGEIRVHVAPASQGDPTDAAQAAFDALGMRKTALRNGVLFYLSLAERVLVVYGDEGIYRRVPKWLWRALCAIASKHLGGKDKAKGLVRAIGIIGALLSAYFVRAKDDVNELSDAVTYGDLGGAHA